MIVIIIVVIIDYIMVIIIVFIIVLLGIVKVYNSLRAVIEYKSPVLKGINGDIISLMSILYKILECTA